MVFGPVKCYERLEVAQGTVSEEVLSGLMMGEAGEDASCDAGAGEWSSGLAQFGAFLIITVIHFYFDVIQFDL